MKITGLELRGVFSTREMGNTGPSDPEKSISHHVIVQLHTDSGITGLGEMSDVNFRVTKKSVENIRVALEPFLIGRNPFDRTAIQVDLLKREWEHQIVCGVDIALHDAVGKSLGVPVYQLFGGKYRDRIPFSYPLAPCRSLEDVAANLGRIEKLLDQGHPMIRYYFGMNLDIDEHFLSELRRRWGEGVQINALDASGRFEVDDAINAINRLGPYKTNVVESPVKGRHNAPVEDFITVKNAVDVPIGEHIAGNEIAAKMAAHDAIDVWNIGAAYLGVTACLKTFATAEIFGAKTLLGSTVELSIGTAARAHIVAAVPNLDLPCYPSGPLVYQEQVVKDRVRYEAGHFFVPEGPGLGMELDEDRLEAQSV